VGTELKAEVTKILIAGVGYRNLRDLSVGPVLIDGLVQMAWPHGVEVEDLSYGPIGVMHTLDERGSWSEAQPLPYLAEVQVRVAEGVTGGISLDNLLIIAAYFGKLPREVIVIEVEAVDEGWGEGLTPYVEAARPNSSRRSANT
jgi:Ni,Fe-hydrogenase maturation factor